MPAVWYAAKVWLWHACCVTGFPAWTLQCMMPDCKVMSLLAKSPACQCLPWAICKGILLLMMCSLHVRQSDCMTSPLFRKSANDQATLACSCSGQCSSWSLRVSECVIWEGLAKGLCHDLCFMQLPRWLKQASPEHESSGGFLGAASATAKCKQAETPGLLWRVAAVASIGP